jgi:hypothetical protein
MLEKVVDSNELIRLSHCDAGQLGARKRFPARERLREGVSWQITPVALINAVTDPDPAAAKRAFDAMMPMRKIDIAAIEAARRG